VVQAVKQGKFHIYPVRTIDQGIEMLTGIKAGVRGKDGTFEEGTIYQRVDKRLAAMAEKLKEIQEGPAKEKKKRENREEEEGEE
jgi:predicted ATP-dependent protease